MGGDEVGDWKEWLGWCLPDGQSGFGRMVAPEVEMGLPAMKLKSDRPTLV